MKNKDICSKTVLKVVENNYIGIFFGVVGLTAASAILAGWVSFYPVAITVASLGVSLFSFGSDYFSNYEKYYNEVQREKLDALIQKKSETIRTLVYQLKRNTKEKRPEKYLTYLSETSYKMEHLFAAGKIDLKIKETFDKLFDLCVDKMTLVRDLWWSHSSLTTELKKTNLEQREVIIKEVGNTIEKISQSFAEFLESNVDSSKCELSQLSQELEQSLKVAKRTNQRMSEFKESINFERE